MSGDDNRSSLPTNSAVDAFLAELATKPLPARTGDRPRLIFSLDATLSRQPTWDMAVTFQADMLRTAHDVGGLLLKTMFFRGLGELRQSDWTSDGASLAKKMAKVRCRGGRTQIARLFKQALKDASTSPVRALVFIGDAMEENPDTIADAAGRLAAFGVPIYCFQEGQDTLARPVFQDVARISRGAYFQFDEASAATLARLLNAVAVYAAGGRAALEARAGHDAGARQLVAQLPEDTKKGR
ncbi:MAG: VWA domain-containing protein [Pseudomonadota bacterium]